MHVFLDTTRTTVTKLLYFLLSSRGDLLPPSSLPAAPTSSLSHLALPGDEVREIYHGKTTAFSYLYSLPLLQELYPDQVERVIRRLREAWSGTFGKYKHILVDTTTEQIFRRPFWVLMRLHNYIKVACVIPGFRNNLFFPLCLLFRSMDHAFCQLYVQGRRIWCSGVSP